MASIDVEKVINGTPQKRLLNAYELMKENYNKESAHEYFNEYSNGSLPFILENSRYIFSEPFYGLEFYRDIITDKNSCIFLSLESEYQKISDYIEDFGDKMSKEQRTIYESLRNDINDILEHTKNTRILASYIKESISDNFEDDLSSLIYEHKKGKIDYQNVNDIFNESMNPITYFVYSPIAMDAINDYTVSSLSNHFIESLSIDDNVDIDGWKPYIETCICMNKISCDSSYIDRIHHIPNKIYRCTYEHFMNEDINKLLNDKKTVLLQESNYIYDSPTLAVNELFNDLEYREYDESVSYEDKEKNDFFEAVVLESTLNLIVTEYKTSNNLENKLEGYALINKELSIEEGYNDILEQLQNSPLADYFIESENVSDEDIDSIDDDEDDNTIGNTRKK